MEQTHSVILSDRRESKDPLENNDTFSFKRSLDKLGMTIQNILFPIFCLNCEREGVWVCDACFGTLDTTGVFCCPVCHAPSAEGRVCTRCAPHSFLDRHAAITPYRETALIGRMIHAFKYQYVESLSDVCERMIRDGRTAHPDLFHDIECLVPVPLHPRRFAERGFNQAEYLARILQEQTGIPVVPLLRRVRYTKHQARLGRAERMRNVDTAFHPIGDIKNTHVLLVDDVFTTGATMQACARVLKNAGVARVSGFSLARG